ncbi:MAG TPA: lipopolysaccharide heptosyltransferase family protein [Phaeodactylibacter sp.]|nr:lipopolysaccharide heptosyltransferase family protein [Phaeodactylibacter sp.]
MKKVLIIRFSSIGDIVLTIPVVRSVKEQLGVEVHFLTKKSFQKILFLNPFIDKTYTFQKNISEIIPELKSEKYDVIIDLHKNFRSKRVKWALRTPHYFTFDKLNWEKWLMVNFKINRLPKIHIIERYMKAVAPLGVTLRPLPSMNLEEREYVVFAIGGAHTTKRLPTQKIIDFCKKIKEPIILLGGKEDAEVGGKVVFSLEKNNISNQCGKTTLEESAEIIKYAKLVITHDTGMMHIAAFFQKKIISIWGNTIPDFGMYPYYEDGKDRNTTLEVKNLSCRPCSKIGYDQCPKGHFKCMNEQTG